MNQNLSLRFKELRRIRGVSGVAIAQYMGVTKAYVSQIENSKRTQVEPAKLLKLANKLGVNSAWLLTGVGHPSIGMPPPFEPIVEPQTPAPDTDAGMVKEKSEIYSSWSARDELREIGAALYDLAARLQRLEKRVYK